MAIAIALVLGFGLSSTLKKNVEVAPWAADGQRDRVHFHTKNTTRLGGGPEEVATSIRRAVFLDGGGREAGFEHVP